MCGCFALRFSFIHILFAIINPHRERNMRMELCIGQIPFPLRMRSNGISKIVERFTAALSQLFSFSQSVSNRVPF